MVNACRNHDIPTMWLEIPLGHTIVSGEDLVYNVDAYEAFFDFCAYHLKNDAIKAVGAKYFDRHFPNTLQLLFSGSVSPSEVSKLTVSNADGEKIEGEWKGTFGGTEWTFTHEALNRGHKFFKVSVYGSVSIVVGNIHCVSVAAGSDRHARDVAVGNCVHRLSDNTLSLKIDTTMKVVGAQFGEIAAEEHGKVERQRKITTVGTRRNARQLQG